MPPIASQGSDPADESPGVIAPLSQLGHGPTTDLKSADATDRDRTASRQTLDPARSAAGAWMVAPTSISVRRGQVHGQARHTDDKFPAAAIRVAGYGAV